MEKLTVIIPVYNRAETVVRTLDSVAAQTYRPFSLVLVDNNSTDGTREVLERWRREHENDGIRVTVVSEERPGASSARARGTAEADSEWVLFFDSDDYMFPGHLERAMAVAEKHPEAEIIGWPVRINCLRGGTVVTHFPEKNCFHENVFHGMFATLRWCCRLSLLRKVGGWNPEVRFWDDIELGARLLAAEPVIVSAGDDVTVEVTEGEDSVTGPTYVSRFEMMECPLGLMASSMPERLRVLLDIKRMHYAGLCYRESHDRRFKDYASAVRSRAKGFKDRMLLRFAFTFTRLGGRGLAYIVNLFY